MRATIGAALLALGSLAVPLSAHAGTGRVRPGSMVFTWNFRFPPSAQQIEDAKDAIRGAAVILCDATEGQVPVRAVRLSGGPAFEDVADLWHLPILGRSGVSYTPGTQFGGLGAHINLYVDQALPDIVAHEIGHLGLWLGEQYDEQRRFGGPCGIGPGFDEGTIDERNHSIMQQSGYVMCVGPSTPPFDPVAGVLPPRCLRDADCPAGDACRAVLMSELSTFANHDLHRGAGLVCPAARAANTATIKGTLDANAAVMGFDPTDFGTADATSALVAELEVIDSKGELTNVFEGASSHRVKLYFEHLGPQQWNLNFGIDAGDLAGGTAGQLQIVDSVGLSFNPDGSLLATSPADPRLVIVDLADGAADLDVDVQLGTPGGGTDGLVEGAASQLVRTDSNGRPLCPEPDCADRWDSATQRFETADQTLLYGDPGFSDWEILVRLHGLAAPTSLNEEPPPHCFNPVVFREQVFGSDQVLLLVDRSGSMRKTTAPDSTQTRFDFAKAAARGFIDLQAGRGAFVGLLSFSGAPRVDRPLTLLDSADAQPVKDLIDALPVGGETGIGTALRASLPEFQAAAAQGRSQTAFLLTDGRTRSERIRPASPTSSRRSESVSSPSRSAAPPIASCSPGSPARRAA
jgi:hypothetical protein